MMELCMLDILYVVIYILCDGTLPCEIYLYVPYIFSVKIVGFNKKTEKRPNMQALCRLPPTAMGPLPSAADGKEDTWHLAVLPGS